jgi:hypothetical protein
MASDTAFLMPIVLKDCGEVFHGLTSLVDVAGGLGGAAATIKAVFPDMNCTVLDLPQVIAKAPTDNYVQYFAGDIFQSIPPANAVFLKVRASRRLLIFRMQNKLDIQLFIKFDEWLFASSVDSARLEP